MRRYGLKAARNLWGNRTLINRTSSEREMRDQLSNMLVVQSRGDGVSEFTGIFLEPKAMFVSATHPADRSPAIDPDLFHVAHPQLRVHAHTRGRS